LTDRQKTQTGSLDPKLEEALVDSHVRILEKVGSAVDLDEFCDAVSVALRTDKESL
jgi:hypothetical protein